MVKASALYMVIVIALIIAVVCSSLIAAAYFYRLQQQKGQRYDNLNNDIGSAINILLEAEDTAFKHRQTFGLFQGEQPDSVGIEQHPWGIYNVGITKAFIQHDTLFKVFTYANKVDSQKWAAVYLTDADRPVSLSGKTNITGSAFIPKSGVQQAYVNNTSYQGDKRLIIGKIKTSERELPPLNEQRLAEIDSIYTRDSSLTQTKVVPDSLYRSFFSSTEVINLGKKPFTLSDTKISGNIIIRSDTCITVDSTTSLKNVVVFARSIIVNSGFHGQCQLFGTDSVILKKDCLLDYPSCIGAFRIATKNSQGQQKIIIGEHCAVNGVVFTYKKTKDQLPSLIVIGKNTTINGQLYAQETLELNDFCKINGSVFTKSFLYHSPVAIYENYLINVTVAENGLSPYYLTSGLLPVASSKRKILQWLESK